MRDARPASTTQPKLLPSYRNALRTAHYSPRTEAAYSGWVRRFVRFHQLRHPLELGEREVAAYLTHLATEGRVSASTQQQALSALLFLYREVLRRPLGNLGAVLRARAPARIPVVLTRAEVHRVLEELEGVYQLVAMLLYGAGLRLQEAMTLRVKDIDFARGEITVRLRRGRPPRGSQRLARAGLGRRHRSGVAARCAGAQVPPSGDRVGMAVGFSSHSPIRDARDR